MSITSIVSGNVVTGNETYVHISAPNNCGTFVFNVDESSFTADMKRELSSINLQMYVKRDNEYIALKDRHILYTEQKDIGIPIYGIPSDCYVGVKVNTDTGNQLVINSFPITIDFDDAPVASSIIFAEKTKQDIADMIIADYTALGNKIDSKSSDIRGDISTLSTSLGTKTTEIKDKIDAKTVEIKDEISSTTTTIGENVDSIKDTIDNLSETITEGISEDLGDVKEISTEILNKVSGAQVDQNSLKPLVFGIDGDRIYISDTIEQDVTYIGRDANGLYVTK